MPNKRTIERVKRDQEQGKSASTQAGEFVKETIDDIRKGKIGARSTKQAITIGLSKARRAGIDVPAPKGKTSEKTRRKAACDLEVGQEGTDHAVNPKRSKAITRALQREGGEAASHEALAKHARTQASKKTAAQRSEIGKKAAQTRLAHQTSADRKAIVRKAARTRRTHEMGTH